MKKGEDLGFFYEEEKQNVVGLLVENNFDEVFEPLPSESLRFFLPLNGTYLIDFQLNFFCCNNVKKIYIIVTHHEKELLQYIEEFQKRKRRYGELDIEIIKMNKNIRTLGDVLRDFKKCVEIYEDVLLMLSDTVPIANIKEVIKAHFANKKKWKNHIMTVFLSYAHYNEKSITNDFVIGYDNRSLKLLLYESLKKKKHLVITNDLVDGVQVGDVDKKKEKNKGIEKKSSNINNTTTAATTTTTNTTSSSNNDIVDSMERNNIIDSSSESAKKKFALASMWNDSNCIKICYDMVIPNLFIVTGQVFQLFEENFDYDCIHRDFIYNILNKQIKIEEIYVHILNEDYNYTECNQIVKTLSDFRIYFQFFKTIIQKSTHPFLSKALQLLPELPKQSFSERGIYKTKHCFIDSSCQILKLASILDHTEIGSGTTLENVFFGKNCKIGENVKIVNSIICKNVIIGDKSVILNSFISEDVVIGCNVFVDEGCVVGKGMKLPSNCVTEKFSRLSLFKRTRQKGKGKKCENGNVNENEKREDGTGNQLESFNLKKYLVKTKYSEEELKMLFLIGTPEANFRIEIPNSSSSSDSDSDLDSESSTGSVSDNNSLSASEEESDASFINNVKKKTIKDKKRFRDDEDEETESESEEMEESDINGLDGVCDTNDTYDIKNLNMLQAFHKKSNKRENYAFANEICILCKEGFEKQEFMSHKILEMKSYRLSLNYTDLDVLIAFFPVFWNFVNTLQFDKDVWIENFENRKLDMLFSSFLLDDQLYYETIYNLILKFSKIEMLSNNVKNNIYGPDKMCSAFEFIYHTDIFEFNYFNEWIQKYDADEYIKNNKRLKAFAEWLKDE